MDSRLVQKRNRVPPSHTAFGSSDSGLACFRPFLASPRARGNRLSQREHPDS
jgi:hypothetical protein